MSLPRTKVHALEAILREFDEEKVDLLSPAGGKAIFAWLGQQSGERCPLCSERRALRRYEALNGQCDTCRRVAMRKAREVLSGHGAAA